MEPRIDHSKIEKKWQSLWEEKKVFSGQPNNKPKYTLVMPPLNVTGRAHLGHALNNTFQDILIRYKKMKGYNTLWVPGTDHAGIATQNRVEKHLKEQGINKDQLTKHEFFNKIVDWKNEYGHIIINQLKQLGCACDWDREKFTLDADFSDHVRKIFVKLYDDGLIYRGNYIVNWCPILQTAISDDEVNTSECKSKLYHLKYQIKGSNEYLIVATSRPETLFGDVAVAYNPNDARYQKYKDCQLIVPICNNEVPLIADEYVKPDFGSGLVKITPAHDRNDFEVGQRHNLPMPIIFDKSASLINTKTKYDGMTREVARKVILKDLTQSGLIEKIEDYLSVSRKCYRSDAIIEPMLTRQWFVKMKPLAELAKNMIEHQEVKIFPERLVKVFYNWVDNIRDWCISRNLVWGHQIPVWYCLSCHEQICSEMDPDTCKYCSSIDIQKDPDVLDTWFSSWLWPFAVFNDSDRDYYFPIDVLITGEDILFFWVIRMMMASGYLYNRPPFNQVYLHGLVRDEHHVKMTKTLGNVIDPLDIIKTYGSDVLRFSLMMNVPKDGDLTLSQKSFKVGQTFCTKYWNVVRYCLGQLTYVCNDPFDLAQLDEKDKKILSQLSWVESEFSLCIDNFLFGEATKNLYSFIWDHFANDYLEYAKKNMTENRQKILFTILCRSTKLLYPIIPHITEEVWSILRGQYNHSNHMLCEIEEIKHT